MKVKQVLFLNKSGKIIGSVSSHNGKKQYFSSQVYPIVVENYIWDQKKQSTSAEKFKDQIKRVHYQETVDEKVKPMLQDDIRRIGLVKKFHYGKSVLEVGCSDGTVSIEIARSAKVKKVVGVDIRKSAIEDGKKLIRDLIKRKEITEDVAQKVKLVNCATENLPKKYGTFDSVCVYEIFEHLAPQDMMPVFQHLFPFIKKGGKFFISVPNRFPDKKYDKLGRTRWKWFDHRNFFSMASLDTFLKNFFKKVKFYPLYPNEKPEESIYLICECKGKVNE